MRAGVQAKKIEIRLNNEEEMANPYQCDRGVLLLSRFTVKSQILCQNSCHSVTRDERKCQENNYQPLNLPELNTLFSKQYKAIQGAPLIKEYRVQSTNRYLNRVGMANKSNKFTWISLQRVIVCYAG